MVEPIRDSLDRLTYRVGKMMDVLEERRVEVPLWPLMSLQRALELATEQQANLDDEKEAVLDRIRQVWYANPELRFMQLLENVKVTSESCCMYYMEDDELVEKLGRVYGEG